MYQFIYYIKAIAALFITNSHFDMLYPLPALSIGGSIGNVLFFLTSGFLLSSSNTDSFIKYVKKKLVRIYRALWPISLILIIVGTINISSMGDMLRTFFFPYKSFWFISAILVFYIVFYFIQKYCERRLPLIFLISVVIYFVFYFTVLDLTMWSVEGAGFFKYIFYFQVMLIGYALKRCKQKYWAYIQKHNKILCGLMVLFLFLYLGTKILIQMTIGFRYFQFLVQIMTLFFGITCFLFMMGKEEQFQMLKKSLIGKCIVYIGASTLEIYLLNYVFCNYAERFVFPVNIIIATSLIFVTGCCYHFAMDYVVKKTS